MKHSLGVDDDGEGSLEVCLICSILLHAPVGGGGSRRNLYICPLPGVVYPLRLPLLHESSSPSFSSCFPPHLFSPLTRPSLSLALLLLPLPHLCFFFPCPFWFTHVLLFLFLDILLPRAVVFHSEPPNLGKVPIRPHLNCLFSCSLHPRNL